jgi:exosortase/archaeosortase family protein
MFLGELHRFGLPRRAALVCGSLALVVFANLARTSFLVWAAAARGMNQMEAWHDRAGTLVMLIVLPSLLVLAHFLAPRKEPPEPDHAVRRGPMGTVPFWAGVGLLAWLSIAVISTELWYRGHEADLAFNERWSVHWPVQESVRFEKTSIPEKSLAMLRCSHSDAAAWEDADGNQWSAFFLRWDPGRNSTHLAGVHRPEVCFPAAGVELREDLGSLDVSANGRRIPFKHELFQAGTRLLNVFYCLWSDRSARSSDSGALKGSGWGRLDAILRGDRNPGQQVLEVVISGPSDSGEATAVFQRRLPSLIHWEEPSVPFRTASSIRTASPVEARSCDAVPSHAW